MLIPTCRVRLTAAGAHRLPWCASVRTGGDLMDALRRSAGLNTTLYRSLSTAQDLRTNRSALLSSREFFTTAVF
jgi:hypothetical protein